MSRPWFDQKTGILMFDQYVTEMPSFKKILEDGVVTNEEYRHQAEKVLGLMQHLESILEPEQKLVCTTALCELSVLSTLTAKLMAQSQKS